MSKFKYTHHLHQIIPHNQSPQKWQQIFNWIYEVYYTIPLYSFQTKMPWQSHISNDSGIMHVPHLAGIHQHME